MKAIIWSICTLVTVKKTIYKTYSEIIFYILEKNMELLQPLWNVAWWKESRHMEDSFRTFISHSQTTHFSKLKRSDYVFVFFGIFNISLVADELHNFLLLQFCNRKGVAWRWGSGSQIWILVYEGDNHIPDSFEDQAVDIVIILSFFLPNWLSIYEGK